MGRFTGILAVASALALALLFPAAHAAGATATARQKSLNEWRALTTSKAGAPRVFVKGDNIRFFFPGPNGVEAFVAHWGRLRVPTDGYRVHSSMLRWEQKLPRMPEGERGWREATVIAGADWRRFTTNFIGELTPKTPGHGVFYEAFLPGRLLYRDSQGLARVAALGPAPKGITVDHLFTIEETLENLGRVFERQMARSDGGDALVLLMAPRAERFTLPLLLDRKQRQCVCLLPAALYDTTEQGLHLTATAQGLSALLIQGHGEALIKNPVSSAARLADLLVETLVRFVPIPLRGGGDIPPLLHRPGMDLVQWEHWLDLYTGTRREDGALRLLLDGQQFFPALEQAIANATNHIHFNVYIFDRDDVAVGVANLLKRRSTNIEVKVILDQMGSIGAGTVPPATPMPEDFEPPSSISACLRQGSRVQVRPFLNPWFSADHSKIFIVDGARAWLGGMNLGREYRYEWHDMMVEADGPVVASLEDEFRRDWAHAGPLGDLAYAASLFKSPRQNPRQTGPQHWIKVRLLPTKTAWKPFAAAVLGSLRHAQNYVYAENPYLFDKRVILNLVKARERGADVRVVLPRINDWKTAGRGNLIIANYLIAHGVRVYFYPAMTHVKALLADGWACVGSGNLNHLSLRVNQEQNIATSDPSFAALLKHDLFEQDFARSYELKQPISVGWVDFLSDLLLEGV